MFAKYSWYFRNALVRANYNDLTNHIHATQEYLMKFFGNLLLGENNELKNRYMRVDWTENVPVNVPVNIENVPVNVPVNSQNGGVNGGVNAQNGGVIPTDVPINVPINIENVPINVPINIEINLIEKIIFDILKNNPKITYEQIAEMTSKNRKTIQRTIVSLRNKGFITRIGSRKTGEWKILTK